MNNNQVGEQEQYLIPSAKENQQVDVAVASGAIVTSSDMIGVPKMKQDKPVQLTFKDIVIKTVPATKKCGCCKIAEPQWAKTIINGVSGTILPG